MEIIEVIKDWPVIVQGALGSFAFWLLLRVASSSFNWLTELYEQLSKRSEAASLRDEVIVILANTSEQDQAGHYASLILYRAARHIIDAFLWVTAGLALSNFAGDLSIIGFIGGGYYLLRAKQVVGPYDYDGDKDERLSEIRCRIEELKEES
jgi:hypothetical protein